MTRPTSINTSSRTQSRCSQSAEHFINEGVTSAKKFINAAYGSCQNTIKIMNDWLLEIGDDAV